MAPHSSTLAWKIPWTEEPGGLQSTGSLSIGHNWATSLHFSLSCIGEGNGNPLQCSYLENPRDGGTWWAAVYGVAQSRTQLKRLSSSSVLELITQLINPKKAFVIHSEESEIFFWRKHWVLFQAHSWCVVRKLVPFSLASLLYEDKFFQMCTCMYLCMFMYSFTFVISVT